MLDEVDAPLDEANVTRFTRLIREMSSRSQFITITHNKRTMEMADALYGITMEEPGCSRVVSVRLREPCYGMTVHCFSVHDHRLLIPSYPSHGSGMAAYDL